MGVKILWQKRGATIVKELAPSYNTWNMADLEEKKFKNQNTTSHILGGGILTIYFPFGNKRKVDLPLCLCLCLLICLSVCLPACLLLCLFHSISASLGLLVSTSWSLLVFFGVSLYLNVSCFTMSQSVCYSLSPSLCYSVCLSACLPGSVCLCLSLCLCLCLSSVEQGDLFRNTSWISIPWCCALRRYVSTHTYLLIHQCNPGMSVLFSLG